MEIQELIDWIAKYPWVLFFAIAILPGFGLPNCPALILFGSTMTAAFGVKNAILLAIAAVTVNILWTWWAAAYPFRNFLKKRIDERVSKRFQGRIEMNERNVQTITFLLHITPGVPLFIQNYFPGLHRLTYWKYLLIAIPIQSFYTALIVATSGQIFKVLKGYPVALLVVGIGIWTGITLYRRRRRKSPHACKDSQPY
tara:strand:+ start:1654 stop:2247 length:594 start_codon:yes stop_codon:yes gene_type:complete